MTSTVDEARVQFAQGEVTTPPLRRTFGRLLYWIVIVVILVLFAVLTLLLSGSSPSKARLSATNPGANGAQALVAVLRHDGVTVDTPATLAAAQADATRDPQNTTFVLYDQAKILGTSQLARIHSFARNLILIDPAFSTLRQLTPHVELAGPPDSVVLGARCDLPAAGRATTVSGFSEAYRITGANETGCFPQADFYSLVQVRGTHQTTTIVGATTVFTNGSILRDGNAAFGLSLFGQTTHVIWYLPSAADANVTQDGVLPIPAWTTLVIVLAGLVLVAAGVWRGRRFGPVVVERMPVFVRASETLEGRARLYQKSSDRLHALDSLRIGAIGRMAIVCGLPTRASVDDVIGAIARVTHRKAADIRELLVDTVPATDSQLLRLSDGLAELEADVARSVRPE